MAKTVLPLVSDEQASPEVRAVFEKFRSALGFVPNLVRASASTARLRTCSPTKSGRCSSSPTR
jgi:hypothetical protein